MKADVLSLAHYPVSHAVHGGQRRVRAIHETLRNAGLTVAFAPIYSKSGYPDATEQESRFGYGDAVQRAAFHNGRRLDIGASDVVDVEPALLDELCALIDACKPRCVQFEQPWLFPLLAKLRARGRLLDSKVIYSSQNVETQLLDTASLRALAGEMEKALVAASDLVFACTESDAAIYAAWGARAIVVAGNGHDLRVRNPARETDWAVALGTQSIAFYVASYHPPNGNGFIEMLSPPGCVPPGSQIVVAGQVGRLIQSMPQYHFARRLFEETTTFVHQQPDADIAALSGLAQGILLPITSGGGSNLKTAEALLSLKPIVATSKSFRGFEEYLSASGVYIADEPAQFKRFVRDLLCGKLGSERKASEVEGLLWSNMLKRLSPAVHSLLK